MNRTLSVMVGFVVALMVAPALGGGECCDKAKATNSWCDHCKVGYVCGTQVKSQKLYDAVHGTAVNAADLKCDACKKAAASHGWCDHCKVGYTNKMLYKTPVGYYLAIGQYKKTDEIKCDGCKKNYGHAGWCEPCKAGLVGCFVYTDRKEFDSAVKAHEIMEAAAANKCDGCAVAMTTDGKCEACKVAYKNGKKVH